MCSACVRAGFDALQATDARVVGVREAPFSSDQAAARARDRGTAPGPEARAASDAAPSVDAGARDARDDAAGPGSGGALAILSTPITALRALSTYAYDAEANRAAPLIWSLVEGPSGMTVDTATGLVSWTPSAAQRGTHPVRLSVSDGRESTEQSYLLVVNGGTVLPNGLHPAALAGLVRAARGGRNWLGELANRPLGAGRATRRLAPRATPKALSRELLRYVIGCALPPGTALRIDAGAGTEAFPGELGLAPRWQTRACDGACRALVSACVLARTNALGVAVPIAWAATAPGRPPAAQLSAEGLRLEGAFYGDLFAPRPTLGACAGVAAAGPAADGRSCTTSPAACGFTIAGPCAEVCDPWLGQASVACRAGRGPRRYRALVVLAPRGERGR